VATVKLPGVTSRAQAWREGMYMAAANRYRRRQVAFTSEMEGFIPALGDLIAISHDVPSWGQAGEIVAWDATSKTATTSEPLDWSGSGHQMALRKRDGSVSGPWQVTRAGDDRRAQFTLAPDITPDTDGSRERTHYAFGPSSALYALARVIGIKPRSPETVEIVAVIESDYVHTADTGTAPGPGAWQLPADFTVPQVSGLVSRSAPNDVNLALLSWRPAPGAERYLIEAAYGTDPNAASNVWTRVGETAATHFTTRATYDGNTLFRVAAIGVTRGPWTGVIYGASADYKWQPSGDAEWTPGANTYWV
jgi:predicted phage tail protein